MAFRIHFCRSSYRQQNRVFEPSCAADHVNKVYDKFTDWWSMMRSVVKDLLINTLLPQLIG